MGICGGSTRHVNLIQKIFNVQKCPWGAVSKWHRPSFACRTGTESWGLCEKGKYLAVGAASALSQRRAFCMELKEIIFTGAIQFLLMS
jgi:hypothetical protein